MEAPTKVIIRIVSFYLLLLACIPSSSIASPKPHHLHQPCKTMTLFLHDIIYNGNNAANATSAIVAAPAWGNLTVLGSQNHFGDVVVINDPLTLDNNLHSKPVGLAQGLYFYDRKDVFTAMLLFTMVLDSKETGTGTISIMGADPTTQKTRDVSVVGGTGDFFLARGVATIRTDTFQGDAYFHIQLDIKLYDCC